MSDTHKPCCSSHKRDMDCATYRRTHFVEVGRCCDEDVRFPWEVESNKDFLQRLWNTLNDEEDHSSMKVLYCKTFVSHRMNPQFAEVERASGAWGDA